MRFVRVLTLDEKIVWGLEMEDGSIRQVRGEPGSPAAQPGRRIQIIKRLAPVEARVIFCAGLNYRRHAAETGAPIPDYPIIFMKNLSAVQHPGDPIELPVFLPSDEVDYEGELAVVIGRTCKNVRRAQALDYVLGYTCANDISTRDWQKRRGGGQWSRSKSFDTFCPLGPCLVTPDEIPNPNALRLRTELNGQRVQDSHTADMIFDVPTLIEFLSGSTTLVPGTVILTGTPEGVGMARTPPLWLKEGDRLQVEIEKIGTLVNPVIREVPVNG